MIKKISSGFTLIEITIVTAVILTLAVGVIVLYRSFANNTNLTSTANQIINTLNLAVNRTLSSEQDSNYGVHFSSNQYILFQGATYSPSSPNNEATALPNGIEINNISLLGENEVVFGRLTGTTTNSGTITLRIINEPDKTTTITVFPSGQASTNSATNPTNTQITDFRHTHFDLGWSIRAAATLTLTFFDPPNANIVQNITMADYFNDDQTEFDWQGTVMVGGNGQTIRVHTHSLDTANAILCIHRDGRVNNKALTISIDGKQIADYTASGIATVGAFGGMMERQ
jgi:type II secretory pathway pseudopilin PulG